MSALVCASARVCAYVRVCALVDVLTERACLRVIAYEDACVFMCICVYVEYACV
jgi:hypothetical protein